MYEAILQSSMYMTFLKRRSIASEHISGWQGWGEGRVLPMGGSCFGVIELF